MIASNLNAMQAHGTWMNANAHNVANVNTENFDSLRTTVDAGPRAVTRPSGSATDLSREIPAQVAISGGFSAQVLAIRTQDEMTGTLLDMKG
jgi:flagellar hook protein FlgE